MLSQLVFFNLLKPKTNNFTIAEGIFAMKPTGIIIIRKTNISMLVKLMQIALLSKQLSYCNTLFCVS